MYNNNTAEAKARSEVSSWFCLKSGDKQGCILYPFKWFILTYFAQRSSAKVMREHEIKLESKTPLHLDHADDLSSLDENVRKMSELLEVLQNQGARIGLKITVKKTM